MVLIASIGSKFWNEITSKWQEEWTKARLFETDPDPSRKKFFLTVAYPYPSSPQHVGHARTYVLGDVHARYKRMQGFNVLFPMGFHYTATPILAMARRLSQGESEILDVFRSIYKVPEVDIPKLYDPYQLARYFHLEIKKGMEETGLSIDWRREFTSVDPAYSRLIEWQFGKLKELGYIHRGSHPVAWCPNDQNPLGQHDTEGDVEPEIAEFTVVKFRYNDLVFPVATLRPETISASTNIWLNPKIDYSKLRVGDENWIVATIAVKKVSEQLEGVKVVEEGVRAADYIGKLVLNPANGKEVPILPAKFVSAKRGTGVVMSVPAHSPWDYVALKELSQDETETNNWSLDQNGLRETVVKLPVAIALKGSESVQVSPSQLQIEKYGIRSQSETGKIEKASQELYSQEYHSGVMLEGTSYSGLLVSEAREKIIQDLSERGSATRLYEIENGPIYCRCGTEGIVKVLRDQWFINYADKKWKDVTWEALAGMSVQPEEVRKSLEYTIGWFKEKACARRSGLGTRLPWDKDWIIESLSDSTIYMSYYIIAKYVKSHDIIPEKLNDSFFDYVFLGMGNVSQVSEATGVPENTLSKIRAEFEYFYPLDSRHSGLDLVTNHLALFIFNHVAIFPRKYWPRQIVANGLVLMEGKKMSKSLGNVVPLRQAVEEYGADPIRLTVIGAADLKADADISLRQVKDWQGRMAKLYGQCEDWWISSSVGEEQQRDMPLEDSWLLSRLQGRIQEVTQALDEMESKKAIYAIFFSMDRDIEFYQRFATSGRKKDASLNLPLLREVCKTRVRLLAPFAPHISEEIWHKAREKGFITEASWPLVDPSKIDSYSEMSVKLIEDVMADTRKILKMLKRKPQKIVYYVAANWKKDVYSRLLDELEKNKDDRRGAISRTISSVSSDIPKDDVSNFEKRIGNLISSMGELEKPAVELGKFDEVSALREGLSLIGQTFGAPSVEVFAEESVSQEDDPKQKARHSLPLRPAIYVE